LSGYGGYGLVPKIWCGGDWFKPEKAGGQVRFRAWLYLPDSNFVLGGNPIFYRIPDRRRNVRSASHRSLPLLTGDLSAKVGHYLCILPAAVTGLHMLDFEQDLPCLRTEPLPCLWTLGRA